MLHDPRKPRTLKPRTLSVLVADPSNFSRDLISNILRSFDIGTIHGARDEIAAKAFLNDPAIDVVLLSWEEGGSFDALKFLRDMRRVPNDRIRRLPAILITASLTRQTVIAGRDAGVDEFLAKPITPLAVRQRLEMVVETPRPFVDCSVYLGPCRRRKNPADYYGAKRRAGELATEQPTSMVDHDEVAAQTPIRLSLTALRQTCAQLLAGHREVLDTALNQVNDAKLIATASKDPALQSGLATFEAYIEAATPLGQLEEQVVSTALGALEQLAALPQSYAEARDSVARALGKAIQKKLAA